MFCTGPVGEQGRPGLVGEKGETGAQGADGIPGAQGFKGDAGFYVSWTALTHIYPLSVP